MVRSSQIIIRRKARSPSHVGHLEGLGVALAHLTPVPHPDLVLAGVLLQVGDLEGKEVLPDLASII